MIIEKFSVAIDQRMNMEMIHEISRFLFCFVIFDFLIIVGVGQPNGWYADYGNQCRSYFLCADQRKTKFNECPLGSKWNPHRLRCDDPKYIAAPCKFSCFSSFCFYFFLFI